MFFTLKSREIVYYLNKSTKFIRKFPHLGYISNVVHAKFFYLQLIEKMVKKLILIILCVIKKSILRYSKFKSYRNQQI